MREVKARPRGWQTYAAESSMDRHNPTAREPRRQCAHCELHGVNLVDRLPRRCPLATRNPLVTLAQLKDTGWRELGRGPDGVDISGALELLDTVDLCLACTDRLAPHRTIRRLRGAQEVTR